MVAIIDYGMGNVASVQKALNFLKIENIITADHNEISASTAILLPGVGSFKQGMTNLHERGLVELLTKEVIENKKKFLGICLGMQLIMDQGSEPEVTKGLGWISGEVIKFELENLAVPHMGWNSINNKNNKYFNNLDQSDFYFVHSYHVVPNDKSTIAATVNYGFEVVASLHNNNIFATQFHPEKSQNAGLELIKNYFIDA
jgi:glutamine amidotransferase